MFRFLSIFGLFLKLKMNSSNSLRVLVFTAGVAAILTVMSLLIPKDGVSIGDVKLKFL